MTPEESHAQLQLILDSSPHAIFIKDLQGRYLQVNQACEKLFRRSREEIIGRTGEEIMPAEVATAFQGSDLKVLVSPGGVETDVAIDREDGRHTYQVHKFPLRDGLGRIYAILGFITDITERREAEEALRISEENFRQLAENISEVFWITDATKNQMIYVSPAYEAVWGRTRESLMQAPQSWLDVIHPDDRERVAKAASSQQAEGKYDETYRIVRPDGSIRWIRDRAYPLRDAQGRIYRLLGIAADITEFRRIQEELSRREEQYREIFAALTEGLIIRDWDETAVEVNPAYCRMLGYSREEILRLKPADYIMPDTLPLFKKYVEMIRGGHEFGFEGQYRRKDGATVPVEASGTVVHYDGRPHILGVVRDITARRNAEAALRRSEAEFRITFEGAPIGMALVGVDGRLIRSNRVLQQLLGYSEAELQAMVFTEFTYPDDVQADLELYRELMEGKRERYQIEKRYVRKGGELVMARLTVSMVRGPANEAKYAIAMVEDITEKKKLEEQFLRAQRLESIGTLASGIAHDLNNILAPMLMAGSLLKDKLPQPSDKAVVTMIEQGAQRGAAIIRQLLTFSRGLEPAKGDIQLKHLISEMVQIITETFPRNITTHSDVSADLWLVRADATQLHQVLMNLCVNARDAMPNGGTLSLSAANVCLTEKQASLDPMATPGRYVRLTVADTGEGIPPEIIDRIFDPFFTTKDVGKGTGLGLSTVFGIVKSHDGFVKVRSERSHGTTFDVYLPAIVAGQSRGAEPGATAPPGHGELILLVDDEAPIREATQRVLEAHNYRVVTAANGEQALRQFINHRVTVRLLLSDVMMPGMDGVHLITALRILEPKIKVVVMSGLDDDSHGRELDTLGISERLRKPFDPLELLRALSRELTSA